MIDALLGGWAWYRRRAGGTWYFVRERLDPWCWFAWVRRPRAWDDILDVETHR